MVSILTLQRMPSVKSPNARGLMTVLERVFRDFKFELPSTGIKSFRVDAAIVANPSEALRTLLRENAERQRDILRAEVTAFADRFKAEHDFELVFEENAITALIELSITTDKTIRALCEEKFHNLQHGLKLLNRDGDLRRFSVTREMVENPDKTISRLVVERFRGETPTATT